MIIRTECVYKSPIDNCEVISVSLDNVNRNLDSYKEAVEQWILDNFDSLLNKNNNLGITADILIKDKTPEIKLYFNDESGRFIRDVDSGKLSVSEVHELLAWADREYTKDVEMIM